MLPFILRRCLWLLPTLVVATYLFFGLLARHGQRHDDNKPLPLFVNLYPSDASVLAQQALRDVTDGSNETAKLELARLGGAALPHVLPQLDALGPLDRGRLALALQPVAERMGLATAASFSSPENATVFWTRFWEDRSVDFRAAVVRRAVYRQAVHGSIARRSALIELDTFALGGVIDALTVCRSSSDVARATRLLSVAAHMANRDPCIHPDMPLDEANACIIRWREWWLSARVDYETLSGSERLSAILTETQFGHWALRVATLRLGVGPDGVTVFDRLRTEGPRTVGLALLSLVLVYTVAFPVGLLSTAHRSKTLALAASSVAVFLFALPVPIASALIAAAACGGGRFVTASAVAASAVGLLAAPLRLQRIAALNERIQESTRYGLAKGIAPIRLLFVHAGKPVGAQAISLAAADFPLAMSAACVVEHAFDLPGLGPHLVLAVVQSDIALLMAFGITATGIHALLLLASDMVSGLLDPRLNRVARGENA